MKVLRTSLVTGTLLLGLMVAAADGASPDSANPPSPDTASTAASGKASTAIRAVKTATRRVGKGRPYDLETERFRGKRVWEVKVAVGRKRPHELLVRRDGRRVVRHRRIRRDRDARLARRAKVSLIRAVRTADRRVSGRFDEAGIDRSRRRLVWEVSFDLSANRDVEVTVNARNGRIIRVERDD